MNMSLARQESLERRGVSVRLLLSEGQMCTFLKSPENAHDFGFNVFGEKWRYDFDHSQILSFRDFRPEVVRQSKRAAALFDHDRANFGWLEAEKSCQREARKPALVKLNLNESRIELYSTSGEPTAFLKTIFVSTETEAEKEVCDALWYKIVHVVRSADKQEGFLVFVIKEK
ncbi:MAG: hypothetical protein NT093_00775 [Candidatus Moranbacteria bacterium]|nr:hypothetical protein [Candidatus Moranbacteria bacterium]